ncbi:MAG: nucleotidyltransferase domain-containing protein [Nanoarchaeota archaeon]|nr:nucleotidyltransferase domain-containing protein [Nanoarchaeota archaeon]
MFIKLNTQKVAKEIFLHPTAERSIRELAKAVHLSPATVSKICRELSKEGIIRTKNMGKTLLVSANLENDDYRFYKRISNIISLRRLVKELNRHNPLAIIVFGSYSKGDDVESSDIDLAVIGSAFKIDLFPHEKELNRKVHLMFFLSEERIPESLKQNILNGIILSGGIL